MRNLQLKKKIYTIMIKNALINKFYDSIKQSILIDTIRNYTTKRSYDVSTLDSDPLEIKWANKWPKWIQKIWNTDR